jgi:dTDP-4-dehydrorhamnose 3,5-epimerase
VSFPDGSIEGVWIRKLEKHVDERGYLIETFRKDWLSEIASESPNPVMAYVSFTEPGVSRGPHEHENQTDLFALIGPGNFKLYLWDNRKTSGTYRNRMVLFCGTDRPLSVAVPPGVVHGYRNVSKTERGMVINFPDALYRGWEKKEQVDEVRHEEEKNEFYRDFME